MLLRGNIGVAIQSHSNTPAGFWDPGCTVGHCGGTHPEMLQERFGIIQGGDLSESECKAFSKLLTPTTLNWNGLINEKQE